MKRQRALTVWGALVIVLVVLVLAAIFMPVSTGERGAAPRARCLSNVKQLVLSEIMYSSDFDDRFTRATAWMDAVTPYEKTEEIKRDPEGTKPGQFGYAFRERADGEKLTSFLSPAQTILIFDSNLFQRSAHSELWSIPRPGRHKGGNVCGFVDGHAKVLVSPTPDHPELNDTLQEALKADDKATTKP